MSKPERTLCSWDEQEIKAQLLLPVVEQPKFYCKNCARVANKKKYLCDPKKLQKDQP